MNGITKWTHKGGVFRVQNISLKRASILRVGGFNTDYRASFENQKLNENGEIRHFFNVTEEVVVIFEENTASWSDLHEPKITGLSEI